MQPRSRPRQYTLDLEDDVQHTTKASANTATETVQASKPILGIAKNEEDELFVSPRTMKPRVRAVEQLRPEQSPIASTPEPVAPMSTTLPMAVRQLLIPAATLDYVTGEDAGTLLECQVTSSTSESSSTSTQASSTAMFTPAVSNLGQPISGQAAMASKQLLIPAARLDYVTAENAGTLLECLSASSTSKSSCTSTEASTTAMVIPMASNLGHVAAQAATTRSSSTAPSVVMSSNASLSALAEKSRFSKAEGWQQNLRQTEQYRFSKAGHWQQDLRQTRRKASKIEFFDDKHVNWPVYHVNNDEEYCVKRSTRLVEESNTTPVDSETISMEISDRGIKVIWHD